ncbi:MAG: GntR family transcriptional regulator [Clostridiales bacterium]|jgi:DNA-binding GntR family transcriptional regulator|nr:GntR family transcriptional regulator [Eubacteriales bacterium]MDH7565693.1 GntR family transcriptional regulator [Clostridiales bacterium]
MLDRNGVIPLYFQLERIIREDIVKGKYKNGDVIPSETQLMKTYNVTRTTVRKAISDLVNEGLLAQVHGKGTFVRLRQIKYNIWNFSGFTDYLAKKNETPVSKVLEKETAVENGMDYFKLVRARGVKKEDGVLYLTIDMSLLPLSVFPGIEKYDFSKESLYNVMKHKYGIFPKRASLGVYPVMGDAVTKKIFGCKRDIPLLKAEGRVYTEEGMEIERVKVIYSPNMEFKAVTNIEG